MNILVDAIRDLLEEVDLSLWDLDSGDLEDNEELIQEILSAKDALGPMVITPALTSKIMKDPRIQEFFMRKINETLEFIQESDF